MVGRRVWWKNLSEWAKKNSGMNVVVVVCTSGFHFLQRMKQANTCFFTAIAQFLENPYCILYFPTLPLVLLIQTEMEI